MAIVSTSDRWTGQPGERAAYGIGRAVRLALAVSRPRFWLYLGGTYAAGFALGITTASAFLDATFLLHLAYFLVPANVLLYGINDLFDRDTDAFNPKKGGREHRLRTEEDRRLRSVIAVTLAASVAILAIQETLAERLLFLTFLFLAVAYSAPPLRLKAVPVLDAGSNILYGIPGILAFYQATGTFLPGLALLAILLWTAAMQLFSAVPDVQADARAGLRTTAVVLGRRGALGAVAGMWLVFATIVAFGFPLFWPWGLAAFAYPALAAVALVRPPHELPRIYWSFPVVNGLAGFALFALAAGPELVQAFV